MPPRVFPAAALACVAFAPMPAFAHAALKKAQPAAGSTVKMSPDAITLDFSEGVVARLSEVAVRDTQGKPIKTAHKAAGTGKTLSLALDGKLAPGTYTVVWRAISVDSHRTQGKFTFTVAP